MSNTHTHTEDFSLSSRSGRSCSQFQLFFNWLVSAGCLKASERTIAVRSDWIKLLQLQMQHNQVKCVPKSPDNSSKITELSVVLGRVHAQDVRNDAVDVNGADEGGEEELFHQTGLQGAQWR